ncbi:60S acidic ribosomal protein P1 [Trichonephila clavata]|uniref:Large ribosomal subunit protein P1 n=1 Tax=Trichonephila clavata TaxID=2740835 RepID=A0A8X6L7D8_TRICU|nr:60S acidic ribosomal protein P1 [Trichonephila clavata]
MLSIDEMACVYSALILQDDDIAISPEKIDTILKAAKVEVEPYWPGLFARCLESVDLKQLITNVGTPSAAPAAAAAPAAEAEGDKKGGKKEEKKEESEDEEDDDMGFGLFD